MNVQPAPTAMIENREQHSYARVQGRWLLLARLGWVALVVLTLAIFFASLPVYVAQLQTLCDGTACANKVLLTPEQAGALKGIGLSPGAYAAFRVALMLALIVVCLVVSTVIAWRRSDDRMALLVALMLVTLGPISLTSTVMAIPSPWQVPNACLCFLALSLLALVFLLFPSGQFVPRWTRWTLVVFLAGLVPFTFFPNAPFTLNTLALSLLYLTYLSEFVIIAVVQLYRYRRVSSPLQRQQTKWVAYGIAVLGIVFVVGYVLLIVPGLANPSSPSGSLYQLALAAITPWLVLLIPLSFGFAIFRYRLWDIDLIINRTLVYGTLSACVIGLYVLLVGYFGALFHTPNDPAISLIATALVAIVFQPLRGLLQRAVNRLMFGQRQAPYQILAHLDQQLAVAMPPEDVLPALVKTIATTLKLPYVAVALLQSDIPPLSEERLVALSGQPPPHADVERLPLVYQGEAVGHEERRRLRRDLHDGLGPTLASLTLTLAAAREYLPRDPTTTDTLLQELATQVQGAVTDIRRLVYELRPPTLDDLGLIGALRDQAARYTQSGLQIAVEAPDALDPLPAAVEVAAYRIGMEALTNVVRHAQACTCTLMVQRDSHLVLTISDDGRGLPAAPVPGIGVRSMRQRAEELGGRCTIEARPEGGTLVVARLPLLEDDHDPSR